MFASSASVCCLELISLNLMCSLTNEVFASDFDGQVLQIFKFMKRCNTRPALFRTHQFSGPRCDVCEEGFYGDPAAGGCRPCNCNGHIDVSVARSCDRRSGECLRCLNNTRGQSCEVCLPGFYRRHVTDACTCKKQSETVRHLCITVLGAEQWVLCDTACNCDRLGAESSLCDESGHCRCRPGFEGLRCQGSNCPSCFSPIKQKVTRTRSRSHCWSPIETRPTSVPLSCSFRWRPTLLSCSNCTLCFHTWTLV